MCLTSANDAVTFATFAGGAEECARSRQVLYGYRMHPPPTRVHRGTLCAHPEFLTLDGAVHECSRTVYED